MKKPIRAVILALLLVLPSCAPAREEARFTVVCTTYPIYLFAASLTQGVEGVQVERLDTGSTSCLHDYSLSMEDMKKLEKAGYIARVCDDKDNRMNHVVVTPKGLEAIRISCIYFQEVENALLKGFSEEEMDMVERFLNRFIQNGEDYYKSKA